MSIERQRRRQLDRKYRLRRSRRLLPLIRTLCVRNRIIFWRNDHGYRFELREYVVLWSPSTNKVTIQYQDGSGKTMLYEPVLEPGETRPKILRALCELSRVVQPPGGPV